MDGPTYTEYYEAVHAQQTDVLIGMVEAGRIEVDEWAEYGALIHDAAWTGNAEYAKRLIELGANVNISPEKNKLTPLHAAAGYNHIEVARILLENGADVDATTVFQGPSQYTWAPHFGETPLHLAVLFCGMEMVQLLLDAGAQPGAPDGTSATPIVYLKRKSWIKCEQDVDAMKSLLKT